MSDRAQRKILHKNKGINLLQVPEVDKTMLNKSDIAQTFCVGFPCEQHLPERGTKLRVTMGSQQLAGPCCGDASVGTAAEPGWQRPCQQQP